MAKVLLINGSPKREGNTFVALTEVAAALNRQGVETEIVNIGTQPVRGCIACNKCKENQNGQCVFNDDVTNQISAKAATADGFVIGSPVYYGQPSGQLLCLIQRMLYSNGAAFAGKPVANVAVCRRGGASMVYQTMNMPWMMLNCPIVTSQYWNIAYGMLPGETAADKEGLQTMRTLAINMAHLIHSLKGNKPQYDEERVSTNMIRQDIIDR